MDDSRAETRANLEAFVAEMDAKFGPPDEADVQRILRSLAQTDTSESASNEQVVADLAERSKDNPLS